MGRDSAPARVLLILGSLDGGGAERVAVHLANRCDSARVDVRLVLLRLTGAYLADVDPARVLGAKDRGSSAERLPMGPSKIAALIRAARPDVLMSFGMGVNVLAWLALRSLGAARPRWICREDSNTDAEIDNLTANASGRWAIRRLIRHIYGSADRLLTVSEDSGRALGRQAPRAARRLAVIHNPIDLAAIGKLAAEPLASPAARPFIVAAGRLVPQKGYDLMIAAFAASEAARGLELVILGEGPLAGALQAQSAALGVAGRVRFAGFQANPWAWFAKARLFVLASRWEGFGNVVAEAMACGAPVLAADCDFGPREQITHGVDGWLVRAGELSALTGGFDALLSDPALASRLADAGRARAHAFDLPAIVEAYTDLFVAEAKAGGARRRD